MLYPVMVYYQPKTFILPVYEGRRSEHVNSIVQQRIEILYKCLIVEKASLYSCSSHFIYQTDWLLIIKIVICAEFCSRGLSFDSKIVKTNLLIEILTFTQFPILMEFF